MLIEKYAILLCATAVPHADEKKDGAGVPSFHASLIESTDTTDVTGTNSFSACSFEREHQNIYQTVQEYFHSVCMLFGLHIAIE